MLLKKLIRNIKIFLQTPKDFIYSFTFSTKKKVAINNYDPKSTEIGNKYVTEIKEKFPELDTHLIGSAGFELAGRGDVDIISGCPIEQLSMYKESFTALFGKPIAIKHNFAEWNFFIDNREVEITLIDKNSSQFLMQISQFCKIKNDAKLLAEYKELKNSANQISMREYQRRKIGFFNKVNNKKFLNF